MRRVTVHQIPTNIIKINLMSNVRKWPISFYFNFIILLVPAKHSKNFKLKWFDNDKWFPSPSHAMPLHCIQYNLHVARPERLSTISILPACNFPGRWSPIKRYLKPGLWTSNLSVHLLLNNLNESLVVWKLFYLIYILKYI